MSFRILVTAPQLEPAGHALLEDAGCRLDFVAPAGARAVMEALLAANAYEGVLSRSIPISGAAIASCPSLRVISRAAAGYDAIDLAAATARGIAVLAAPGANAQSVAEYTIGLIIAAARDIPRHDRATQAGAWDRATLGLELHGRTLGLLGYGRIAKAVARIALAIGMRVAAWSPRLDQAGDIAPVERAASVEDLLERADILSLHAPLNAATRTIINAAALARLGPQGILVNTARGGLVDEAALVAALRDGRLRGAALDVRPAEPPPPDLALGEVPNLILTPHMGAATTVARAATARAAATHLLDALAGRPLPPGVQVNAVTPPPASPPLRG
jgi:D-3-phosphoglycerate dehydrogenase